MEGHESVDHKAVEKSCQELTLAVALQAAVKVMFLPEGLVSL